MSSYIASTKFDSRNKVPYSGLLRLLSQALQQVLSETEEEVHRFFELLKAWLGAQFSNISVLADLVPELKSLLVAAGYKDQRINTEISMKADKGRGFYLGLHEEMKECLQNGMKPNPVPRALKAQAPSKLIGGRSDGLLTAQSLPPSCPGGPYPFLASQNGGSGDDDGGWRK